MGNKKHLKSVICLLLTMLMAFSVVFVAYAAESDVAQTGATTTVYFKNTENWSNVSAYVWVKGTQTSVKSWPGEAMTLHEDNIYKYTVNGDYNMIIFNNGSDSKKTADLDLGQDGYLYDYSKNTWEKYAEPTPTDPSSETQETQAPKPTTPVESKIVFFKNTDDWSSVNAYMWTDGTGNNKTWPGEAMTNIGEDIWQYEVKGSWNMIIFNNGSGIQTGNLTFPGNGYIYDYATSKWDVYDTSAITVKSVSTDLKSPQYKDTEILLSAEATSTEGAVSYKFSVTNGSKTTVLSDYSAVNSVKWTPSAVGTYTITYDFKDAKGNENQRTATYVIEDDTVLSKPVIKKVTPGSSQVKIGEQMNLAVTAGGGKIGTNLLFYKYTVKDSSGKVLNVPFYTKKAYYNYTPKAMGQFTITVSVQNAYNDIVERTYTYNSVEDPDNPTVPTTPTQKPTNPNPSGILGDADNNGALEIFDATCIQKHQAYLITDADINLVNADYDKDGIVSVTDATRVQQKLANIN